MLTGIVETENPALQELERKRMSGPGRTHRRTGLDKDRLVRPSGNVSSGHSELHQRTMVHRQRPSVQRMLQTILADRFKLVLKRDVKEMQGYNLVLAQEGELKLSAAQTAGTPPEARQSTPGVAIFPLLSTTISRLASSLQQPWLGRPIADRTGLTGLYDIWLEFPEIGPAPQTDTAPGPNRGARDRLERMKALLPSKLESTTGLRLEPAKVPVETLVIVSVERPSDN